MRNLIFLALLLMGFCFFSCQKEEMLYSCDSNIEKWAKENSSEINRMNREEFLKISNESRKKAAYRAFNLENKQRNWEEKYQELKKLNWSEDEWKHIDLIYSLVLDKTMSMLNTENLEESDKFLIFVYRWEDYARTTLGWNKKQIYAVCYTVERVINKQGDLDVDIEHRTAMLTRSESGDENQPECSCSQKSSYCDILDHEGPDYTTCKTPNGGSCKVVSGCGLFWQFNCDGMCLGLHI